MGLADVIVTGVTDTLRALFSPVTSLIESHGRGLLRLVTHTPHPDRVFGAPTNGPWPRLYDYYWESVVPIAVLLLGLMVGLVILLGAAGPLFSGYHRTRLRRRTLLGLLGILSWWWLAALALRVASALSTLILPSLSSVSLFETLSFGAMGVLGFVLALAIDLTVFVLIALVYFVRELVLYLFVLLMPLLIVLWIPGLGPFGLLSGFARRLAGLFVPFLFMTVPVAGLFRVGSILGHGGTTPLGSFGLWLGGLVTPLLTAIVPVVLVRQAGSIYRTGERLTRRVSRSRAHGRSQTIRDTAARTRGLPRRVQRVAPVGGADDTAEAADADETRPDDHLDATDTAEDTDD